MRPRTACLACRNRRRRCNIKTPGEPCSYCTYHRVSCSLFVPDHHGADVWVDHDNSYTSTIEATNEVVSNDPLILPPELYIEISSAYFDYIHDPTQSLFHRPSFTADVKNGTVPRTILLAIIALAARFSDHEFFRRTEPRLRGIPYIREAERSLDLHHISRDTVRTAVLLGAYYGADGDSMHENLYYTIACRIGGLLMLPGLEFQAPLARELDIRLWWTLEMIDVWSSNGVQLPRILPTRTDVPYPLPETIFLSLEHIPGLQAAPTTNEQLPVSILAEQIKLNSILADIAKLNRASAESSLTNTQIHARTEALANRLADWHRQLPPWLTDTPANLGLHASSGTGGPFVSLYLGYYHFSQLLFYRYLHLPNLAEGVVATTSPPHTSQKLSYAQRCRDSATALCEMLYRAYATPGAEVYYSMVGHVLTIASTVQLHILLFSSPGTAAVDAARRRLERNFQVLTKLQTLWRALDVSFARFRAFHDACVRARRDEGVRDEFRLDGWMVRFLLEFARPLGERVGVGVGVGPGRGVREGGTEGDTEEERSGEGGEVEGEGFDLRRWSVEAIGIDFERG